MSSKTYGEYEYFPNSHSYRLQTHPFLFVLHIEPYNFTDKALYAAATSFGNYHIDNS